MTRFTLILGSLKVGILVSLIDKCHCNFYPVTPVATFHRSIASGRVHIVLWGPQTGRRLHIRRHMQSACQCPSFKHSLATFWTTRAWNSVTRAVTSALYIWTYLFLNVHFGVNYFCSKFSSWNFIFLVQLLVS